MNMKREIDLEVFAEEAGENGKWFIPALYDGGKENFLQQEVFVLKFSSLDIDGLLSRAFKYDVVPAFVYSVSYGSGGRGENSEFYAVFINDCAVCVQNAVSVVTGLLLSIFPEADKGCKDSSGLIPGGNRILYKNQGAEMNIRDLAVSVQEKFLEKGSDNYSKLVKRLGLKLDVNVKNNVLSIHRFSISGKNDVFGADSIIIIENAQKPYNSYLIETNQKTGVSAGDTLPREPQALLRNKSCQDMTKICPLLRDFYEKEIPYSHKLLLASNLIHIKGGKEFFFNGLKEHRTRWEIEWRYIKAYMHNPQECCSIGCPYAQQCRCGSLYQKLLEKVKHISDEPAYIPLEEAEKRLEQSLQNALCCTSDSIHLIKAQTALGKTTAYCRMAQRWRGAKPFMIAVPTIKLQNEVHGRLAACGVDAEMTPGIEGFLEGFGDPGLQAEVSTLYEKGFGYRVKRRIKEYIKENEDMLAPEQICAYETYQKRFPKFDGSRCIVTTHAMLLALQERELRKYEIIVDEDILMTIFKNTDSFSFQDMEAILHERTRLQVLEDRIREILGMEDGSMGNTDLSELDSGSLDQLYEEDLPVVSSIPDFMASSSFYVDVEHEQVHYFRAKKIPNVKLTVVSASLNLKLYKDYCGGRSIIFEEIPPARYKGNLVQYTEHTMSRRCIGSLGFDKVKESVQNVTGRTDMKTITFKKFNLDGDIYYGKTEGFNDYCGQDLAVVGTPHNVPFVYRLIGHHLGYDAEGSMNPAIAEHNGYSFRIMTFKDLDMRNLQFYFLESELEQAVGRARLLRHPCTVYLFSNFPCRQAEIIQRDYICK